MTKIIIALATFNRKKVTELCLANLKEILNTDTDSRLVIYDDASSIYDESFLKKYSNDVLRFRITGGIERSRARAFRDFEHIYLDYDLLYITDNDTIHDPYFLNILRDLYTVSSVTYEKPLPIGLFNSVFHSQNENIIKDEGETSLRKTCPGVSQCYDRKMVKTILDFLNKNPIYETAYGFDYFWPAQLRTPFLQTNISYLEHFARDKYEVGIHSTNNKKNPKEDFERDRALNPTKYLSDIREQIIETILK